ncbi:hypothetical protein SUGI_0206530 [Cryptomeria japonica]|nr:hypothetical protein SUGI_0206530 [Cryptomeria japonica]
MEVESFANSKRKSVKLEESFSVNASNNINSSCITSDTDSTVGDPAFLGRKLGRKRKRFVGIRQRPSGRWVAEIKDTIQKIRLWLGTFDTAEDAARAYDEAACLLRGNNTRTNFWPSPSHQAHGTSVLPSRTARMLQLRIKDARARKNNDGMISESNSSQDHSLCNQFMQSKLNLEAEMPSSEEDNMPETKKILSLTSGMSNKDECMDKILHSTVPNKPPTASTNDSNEDNYLEDKDGSLNPSLTTKPLSANSIMSQRNPSKEVSQVLQTNPNKELPLLLQKTLINPNVVQTNPNKELPQLLEYKDGPLNLSLPTNPLTVNNAMVQRYSSKDGSLNLSLPSNPLPVINTMDPRNPSKGVSHVLQTNPNKELPQLLQQSYCNVEGVGGEDGNLSLSSVLMETDDSPLARSLMSVECINSEDAGINYSLHGEIADMDDDFDFSDVSELASGYSPFAIAEEIAEPVKSGTPNIFMEDEAQDSNGSVQSLEEQNSSMFREAIKRRMYERKISASLYAMNGVSECFHYTSEFAESMNLASRS